MTVLPLDPEAAATVDTPYVVVDLDRTDARIERTASVMRERGVALRPHTKTHKSIAFARRQIAAGAVGLTVATVGEAEVFVDAGFDDVFIAYPVMALGMRAERLRRLAGRCSLSVGADSVEGVRALAAALSSMEPAASASRPRVLIEIDVGGSRTGARPGRAGELTRAAVDLRLEVTGVFPHAGHGYAGRAERVAAAEDEVVRLTEAAESLQAHGVEPLVVSAGSTPTAELSARGAVTEERPGTYIF